MSDYQTYRTIELCVAWFLMGIVFCWVACEMIWHIKKQRQWAREKQAARWDCCNRAHGEYGRRQIVFLDKLPACQSDLLLKSNVPLIAHEKHGVWMYYDDYRDWYHSLPINAKQ